MAFLCVSLAVWRLNAVLIPLNPGYKSGYFAPIKASNFLAEFNAYLQQSNCEFLLIDAGFVEHFNLTDIGYNIQVFDEKGLKQCKCRDCQQNDEMVPMKESNGGFFDTVKKGIKSLLYSRRLGGSVLFLGNNRSAEIGSNYSRGFVCSFGYRFVSVETT